MGEDEPSSGPGLHQVRVPGIGVTLQLPPPERIAWYLGLAAMAAFDIVDWELALIIGIGHLLADNSRYRFLAEMASGAESGA